MARETMIIGWLDDCSSAKRGALESKKCRGTLRPLDF